MSAKPKKTKEELAKEEATRHKVTCGLGRLLRGGVIVVVDSPEKAILAEKFGARAVIAISAGLGATGSADPQSVKAILGNVMIPVFGRVGVGHKIETAVMVASSADGIDESELLTAASATNMDYRGVSVPVLCGVNVPAAAGEGGQGGFGGGFGGFGMVHPMLGGAPAPAAAPVAEPEPEPAVADTGVLDDALLKIFKGAAILRTATHADPGTLPNEDVTNMRYLGDTMKRLNENIAVVAKMLADERAKHAKEKGYNVGLLNQVAKLGHLPVPLFANAGIAFPLDAAMAMSLGYDGIIASKALFSAVNAEKRMRSLVLATTYYKYPEYLSKIADDHGIA